MEVEPILSVDRFDVREGGEELAEEEERVVRFVCGERGLVSEGLEGETEREAQAHHGQP